MSLDNTTTTTTASTITSASLTAVLTMAKGFGVDKFPYEDLADERTRGWLLVDSFWPVAALVGLYLLLVRRLPQWMARRKPFELRGLLVAYNLAMATLNAHICRELLVASWRLGYNYRCQPCRPDHDSPEELRVAAAVWWFYFSKLLEFSDTAFFVLRKKQEQLSFLHVYHHSTMFPLWWIAVKWVPTGSTFFPAAVNSFVHVIMYSYYGLSALGPRVQRWLWWKRHLTALQLVQFTWGLVWALQALVVGCDFPAWINWATVVYMISFLVLFGRFYVRKYQRKRHEKVN